MPLFKRKPHPVWFVMRPTKGSSNAEPKREGPYTRTAIAHMYGEGMLADGALIWTNEKIFPNAEKPNSMRPVRIMEWRRLDQLPDPVVRQIAEESQQTKQEQPGSAQETHEAEAPAVVSDPEQIPAQAPPPSSPPPSHGDPPGYLPASHHVTPPPSSMYPAGPSTQYNPNPPQPQMHTYNQPSVYPTAAAYPPQASGAPSAY